MLKWLNCTFGTKDLRALALGTYVYNVCLLHHLIAHWFSFSPHFYRVPPKAVHAPELFMVGL